MSFVSFSPNYAHWLWTLGGFLLLKVMNINPKRIHSGKNLGNISPENEKFIIKYLYCCNLVVAISLVISTFIVVALKLNLLTDSEIVSRQQSQKVIPHLLPFAVGGADSLQPHHRLTQSITRLGIRSLLHSQAINRSLISKAPIESALRGFCPPLKGQSLISQGNGGITHSGRAKYAYDYAVGMGTPVFSMRRAKVLQIQDGYPDTGGSRHKATKSNFVLLEHPGGYRSAYVHLQQSFSNKVNVKSGMWVATGQLIGYSGNSGWSSGPHLHVEVQEPSNNLGFSHTIPFQISNNCPGRKA